VDHCRSRRQHQPVRGQLAATLVAQAGPGALTRKPRC
jgi:hypothetical protein